MKKIILAIFVSTALISCDKNAIQQTTDSIKSADSLFTKANDGLKTLDSISKTINDSEGIARKVILPEIKNQSKKIDSTIKSGGWKIDSINKEISKITKNVVVGTEVVKTLDSANDAINRGENPLKVLTKTADKILKQTKKNNPPQKVEEENKSLSENQTRVPPEIVSKDPLLKTATLEIEVEDLSAAKEIVAQKMQNQNAEIITQKLSKTEGFEREYYTTKVPLKNFDGFISDLSADLGSVQSKNISTEGSDYFGNQLCDVEIVLVQKENLGMSPVDSSGEEKSGSFSSKSSQGFMKGFETLQNVFIALLPFWPFFLIGGIVLFFVTRNKKKKALLEKIESEKTPETFNDEIIPSENEKVIEEQRSSSEKPDYSKYQPKK